MPRTDQKNLLDVGYMIMQYLAMETQSAKQSSNAHKFRGIKTSMMMMMMIQMQFRPVHIRKYKYMQTLESKQRQKTIVRK
jgi:hypothetical protein